MMERVTQFLNRKSVIADEVEHFRAEERAALKRDTFDRRIRAIGRRTSDVANWCYAGGVKVVQFPAYAFDLLDRHGKPDHSKMGPFLVSQELIAICAYDVIKNKQPLQAAIVIIIAVLSFASASLMRYFVSKSEFKFASENRTSATAVTETKRTVIEAHYTVDGVPATSNPPVPGALTMAGES